MFLLLDFGLIAVKKPLEGVFEVRKVVKVWKEEESWLFRTASLSLNSVLDYNKHHLKDSIYG